MKRLDEPVLDALVRLLRLLEEPAMLRYVAPLIRQEILVRLLHGPHAAHLAHLAAAGSPRRQVADIVTWLKQHFTEPVAVDELADRANMSASTFRQHFRAMTGMSPVQFQKRLRLQEARQLMLNDGASAAGASALVGYESASQFNREYRRLFARRYAAWTAVRSDTGDLPVLFDFYVDHRVIVYALALTGATAVIVGIRVAARLSRTTIDEGCASTDMVPRRVRALSACGRRSSSCRSLTRQARICARDPRPPAVS